MLRPMCAWQPEVGEECVGGRGVITWAVGGNEHAVRKVASNIHFPTFYARSVHVLYCAQHCS